MPDTITAPPEAPPEPVEARSAPEGPGLPVETATASSGRPAGLTDAFRAAGFPGEIATVPYDGLLESRALTVTGGPDPVQRVRAPGVPLGFDSRWAWTVFPRIGVDAGTTSVDVLRQSARSLATAANVIRAIDATTAKPETSSTVEVIAAALKQVATISKGIPNVYLESSAINSIIESDLRLAVNAGLDSLVLTALGGAGFQDPGTNLLDGIRKAITTVEANGYAPDTVILRPQDAEALDLMKSDRDGRRGRLRLHARSGRAAHRVDAARVRRQERRRARRRRRQRGRPAVHLPDHARAVRGERRPDEHLDDPDGGPRAVQHRADRRRRAARGGLDAAGP
jgi:hypothetical protein